MTLSKTELLSSTTELVSMLNMLYKDWEGVKQFEGTPDRVARMYQEYCWSPEHIKTELDKQFRVFDSKYDEMVVTGPLTIWTLCPHHLLPCEFKVTVGLVPSEGKVLGLSKYARIAEILAKRPIMQEQYCTELAEAFQTNLEPAGVAVYVVGRHGCMTSRGVKQASPVTSSVIRGVFENSPTREEFYAIARNHV